MSVLLSLISKSRNGMAISKKNSSLSIKYIITPGSAKVKMQTGSHYYSATSQKYRNILLRRATS